LGGVGDLRPGRGVAIDQVTTWGTGNLTVVEALELLSDVRWESEARCWENVAARSGVSGSLNFGGGAKDAGGRVADALLSPASSLGRQIRGLQ
jgi:hypothetical protein